MILDNHSAHGTHEVRNACWRYNIQQIRQPTHSPELNAIETLWSRLKARLNDKLRERMSDPNIQDVTRDDWYNMIRQSLLFTSEEVNQLMLANRRQVKEQFRRLEAILNDSQHANGNGNGNGMLDALDQNPLDAMARPRVGNGF